jgi:enoyl-CoA hydratase
MNHWQPVTVSDDVSTNEQIGAFRLTVDPDGVATVLFSRPPVNAMSFSVYEDLGRLVARIERDSDIRVVVLTAPDDSRAWCGGADLNDFVGMNPERRKERYRFINAQLPGLYRLDRPVIAAINGPAIGVGLMIAGLCDMRVAAEDSWFACPELDYGLIGGGIGLMGMLKLPEAKIREMYFTGDRFTARDLESTGLFNYVVPREEVLPRAQRLARRIATKSLPVLRAQKVVAGAIEKRTWMEAYLDAQALSSELAGSADSGEGVRAFLEHREANYVDA